MPQCPRSWFTMDWIVMYNLRHMSSPERPCAQNLAATSTNGKVFQGWKAQTFDSARKYQDKSTTTSLVGIVYIGEHHLHAEPQLNASSICART